MVGTTIAHYRVLSLLGRGGMGDVYLAEDLSLGRKVALKILPPTFSADADRQRRFEREARAIAALNHPGIVTIYGIDHAGSTSVLAMEFVDGQPLAEIIPAGGMSVPALLRIAIPLVEAVAVAHHQGIVHRDLKPANVMVTHDGRVKVLDFGLAKLLDEGAGLSLGQNTELASGETRSAPATQLGVIVGTVHYMAPEQAQGLPVDRRTDIFSLGVVLYEMAAGVRPFSGDTAMAVLSSIIKEPPRALGELKPELPAEFIHLVARCLEKDPDRRPQDAFDLRSALEDFASGSTSSGSARWESTASASMRAETAPSASPVASASSVATAGAVAVPLAASGAVAAPARRPRLITGVVGVVVLLAAVAGAWWMFSRSRAPAMPIAPNRVAIAPIVNRTGEASLDTLGPMAAASIGRMLSGEGIDVVRPEESSVSRASKPRDASDTRADLDFARRQGAGLVLSGDLATVGNEITFQGRMASTETGSDVRALEPLVMPRGAGTELAARIQQQVVGATLMWIKGGGGMTGFSRERLAMMTPPTYDAYREFVAGLDNFGTDMREASRHFETMLELDPRLWWCLGWLVPAYEMTGQFEKAEQVVEKLRPTVASDGKPVLDYFRAHLGGRLVEAYTAAQRVLATYPGYLPTATIAAWTARDIGRPQEALDALRPFAPDPRVNAAAWRGWVETIAQAYHMLARYDDERQVGVKAAAAVPGTPLSFLVQARALAAQGRVDELGKVLEACLTVPPSARPRPGMIILTAASELRTHARVDESKRVAQQALTWVDGLDTTLASSAPMQNLRGYALTLLERWSDASTVSATLAASAPSAIDARSEVGVIAARRGDIATARKAIDDLAQMNRPYIRGAHTFARARVAAALGDREKTVDLLREAFAEGQPLAWPVHDDYAFEPVRGYAPFETLVAIK